jgi:hypothetical protein
MTTDPHAYCGGRRDIDFNSLRERVLALRKLGKRYREIAEETGAPVGTVCSMIQREAKHDRSLLASALPKPVRYTDDPRARLPDTGRLPLPPASEVHRSSPWLTRIQET